MVPGLPRPSMTWKYTATLHGLAVQGGGIDDASHVLHRHVVEHRDPAGAGVDRDMDGVGAVAVGAFGVVENGFDGR